MAQCLKVLKAKSMLEKRARREGRGVCFVDDFEADIPFVHLTCYNVSNVLRMDLLTQANFVPGTEVNFKFR